MSSRIVSIYLNCLPPFLVNSIFYGYIVGYETSIKRNPIERFESMISYTTYGILFGLFYPITYPFCAGYTIYKKIKNV